MKIPRSEAVDKSPGVFYDAEHDFKGHVVVVPEPGRAGAGAGPGPL